MTSLIVAACPSWKYGAREARPRSGGARNFPMSAHRPVDSARPGSQVSLVSPEVLFCRVSSGRCDPHLGGSAVPVLKNTGVEWPPTFGVLWQPLQCPAVL